MRSDAAAAPPARNARRPAFLLFSFSHRTVIPRPVLLTQCKVNMRWTPAQLRPHDSRIALKRTFTFYRFERIKQDQPDAEIRFQVVES